MKSCSKCHLFKPFIEFRIDRSKADGYQPLCKACRKLSDKEYRDSHKGSQTTANYRSSEKGINAINRYEHSEKRKKASNNFSVSEKGREKSQKWRLNNPVKASAQRKLNLAIRSGLVTKQSLCECCGSDAKANAHHDDYADPLNVRWLCDTCHAKWHKINGPGLNGD